MLPDSADQCTFCWEKLQPEVYGEPVSPQSKPVRKLPLVLFFLAWASIIFWWKFQRQAPPPEPTHVELRQLGGLESAESAAAPRP